MEQGTGKLSEIEDALAAFWNNPDYRPKAMLVLDERVFCDIAAHRFFVPTYSPTTHGNSAHGMRCVECRTVITVEQWLCLRFTDAMMIAAGAYE